MTETPDILRAATPEQRDACLAIREAVFVQEQQVPPEMEWDEHDATALHFLALREGRPLATARVVFKEEGRTAKIGRVAVRAEARGTGLGAALMRAVEADPALRRVERCALEAQLHAIPFYERLGYAASGEVFLDAGIPHRFMAKAVPPR